MSKQEALWLVTNEASGSNSQQALETLQTCCGQHGLDVARHVRLPSDDLPAREDLESAGIGLLAVFAGDGTTNALLTRLEGWKGRTLVLPGGTMNLLSKRLHGDRSVEEIVADVVAEDARIMQPGVARCEQWTAMVELLVGPATIWAEVREAMRDIDVLRIAGGLGEALAESTAGVMVRCVDPPLGRREGYPLVSIMPEDEELRTSAYHADTIGEFAQQGMALLKRDFREGPHDLLGTGKTIEVESVGDEPLQLLIDGETQNAGRRTVVRFDRARMNLLTTRHA